MIAKGDDDEIDSLLEQLSEENPGALLADNLRDALIGITANHHHPVVAVYDLEKCIEILMEDNMSADDAMDFLSFNTLGAYVGPNGPLFVRTS